MRNSAKALYCMQAFRHVKRHVQDVFGAANVGTRKEEFIAGEDIGVMRRGQYLTFVRAEIEAKGATGINRVAVRAAAAKHFGTGNCMEQGCLAMYFLHDKGVPCTLVSVEMPGGNDQHVFVVTAEVSSGTDLADCGSTPVCDPWVHEKAIAETVHGFGSGVSTAVKHAAVLKALEFGTKMTRLQYIAGKVIETEASAASSSSA